MNANFADMYDPQTTMDMLRRLSDDAQVLLASPCPSPCASKPPLTAFECLVCVWKQAGNGAWDASALWGFGGVRGSDGNSKQEQELCTILVLLCSEMIRRQAVERGREGERTGRQRGVGPGGGRFSESFKTVQKLDSFILFPKDSLSPSSIRDVEGVKLTTTPPPPPPPPRHKYPGRPPGRQGYLSSCRKAQALADAVLCPL